MKLILKRGTVVVWLIFGMIFLCACGDKGAGNDVAETLEIETKEEEVQESETRAKEEEENIAVEESTAFVAEANESGYTELVEDDFAEHKIIAVPAGFPCRVDLNSDGISEDVIYEPQSSDGINVELLFAIYPGSECLTPVSEWKGEVPQMISPSADFFFVVDLDSKDDYREVVILDEGFSDDPEFRFMRYQDDAIVYLGSVFTDSPYNELMINGNGKITGSGRLSIFQTWNAPFTWELEGEKIRLVEEEWYYPYNDSVTGQDVKQIKKMTVYSEPDLGAEKMALEPSDATVTFGATDNKNWLQFFREDGAEGWIYLNRQVFMEVDGEEVPTEKVFENLHFAG
ncbi:MAG: hypothetical protein IJN54_10385 [Lachnospiraceae bacterium]|nr:hypothetical protein [Lachnospiraceae bacterium]